MTALATPAPATAAAAHPSAELAAFAAGLCYQDIPEAVRRRAEDLLLDTLGSILAGAKTAPIRASAAEGRRRTSNPYTRIDPFRVL